MCVRVWVCVWVSDRWPYCLAVYSFVIKMAMSDLSRNINIGKLNIYIYCRDIAVRKWKFPVPIVCILVCNLFCVCLFVCRSLWVCFAADNSAE